MKKNKNLTPLLALCASLASPLALAQSWPGTAPCDTTLQACINAAPSGGIVHVRTNAIIDESLHIDKSLHLIAVDGYRPVLAAGRTIGVGYYQLSSGHIEISGFTLLGGSVRAYAGADATVVLRRLVVHTASGVDPAITVSSMGEAFVRYDIGENLVRMGGDISANAVSVSPSTRAA
ncbi:hypothetical protein [Tahibacter amnicola]|uniref:Auto-transporter adhesin head GIN domain-containing protein n=1 Tax=Tahibacter amnicola TaxID=2976241 RepID=A0ABY6BGF9_9GAMM|nr:hypothetical protein [Tahibacter amnicola]UXI68686.1 hypothetical protein N4264_03270 [Tahibacter amnicola]